MTPSMELWQINQDLADACLDHPFVQGIGKGTLAKSKFSYYIGQDAFFLEAFARSYSVAAAKAPDWEGFQIFHQLATGVLDELKLHQKYAQTWGVDLEQIEPGPATLRYTHFLAATCWSRESGITAIAMIPCMRLYVFLGQELARAGLPEHLYRHWIETYSHPDFEQLVVQLETLADRYLQLQSATSTIASTYRYALQCELEFFQGAWESA